MAATNKCLAQGNKSGTGVKATEGCSAPGMWEREKNNPRRAVFFGPSCRGNFSPYFRRELSVVGQWQAKVMRAGWRSKTVAFVAILALLTFGALATASADPRDLAQSADIAVAQAL